jgi:hypothetical protein
MSRAVPAREDSTMRIMLPLALATMVAVLAATGLAPPAAAQYFGTEDGYGGDGIGWGPAYRPETTFRPAIGFYGGVERPYPYGAPGTTTPVTRNGVTYGPAPYYAAPGPVVRRHARATRKAYVARRSARHAGVAARRTARY